VANLNRSEAGTQSVDQLYREISHRWYALRTDRQSPAITIAAVQGSASAAEWTDLAEELSPVPSAANAFLCYAV